MAQRTERPAERRAERATPAVTEVAVNGQDGRQGGRQRTWNAGVVGWPRAPDRLPWPGTTGGL